MPTPEDLAPCATIAEADAEWARNVGAERPEQAWILSDRDVWYRNPAYAGPAVRHPEDDNDHEDDAQADADELHAFAHGDALDHERRYAMNRRIAGTSTPDDEIFF